MGKMKEQAVVEVGQEYLDSLESDNFKMYKQVQELTAQVAAMTKDMEVLAYQARLNQAQAQIYADRLGITKPDDDYWEPDSIEREEGL